MLYISSVIDKDLKIGITDTDDNVEEFYTDSQIVTFLKKNKLNIYGTSYYNYKANCTPIKINQTLDAHTLNSLLRKWKEVHNQWSGYPVEDYLASAKIGTAIRVEYVYRASSGDNKFGVSQLAKLDYDKWYYLDKDNIMSGNTGDSRFAAHCLETACIYSRVKTIDIYGKE